MAYRIGLIIKNVMDYICNGTSHSGKPIQAPTQTQTENIIQMIDGYYIAVKCINAVLFIKFIVHMLQMPWQQDVQSTCP